MPITLYERKLLNEPAINRKLSDIFYGIVSPSNVRPKFSNADGYFTDLLNAGEEFRNKRVKLRRYEPGDSPAILFELSGIIIDFNFTDVAEFTVSVNDPDPLQTLLPKKVYETDDLPENPPNEINPERDLGKPFPLPFGMPNKVSLMYVHANFTTDEYDYIVAVDIIQKVKTVYRNKVVVDSSEYTVYDGSQSSPYPGTAFIRFTKEQRDFQGRLYEFTADIWGFTFGGGNHSMKIVDFIENILSNSKWGLGETINTASFDAARTAVAGFGGTFNGTGVIDAQVSAQDILNELLFLCRGKLHKNEAGEWTLTIDTYQEVVTASFGSGDKKFENIKKISSYKKTPTKEAIKKYTLNYRYNRWEQAFANKNERNIFAFGEDKEHNTKWVRNHTTADIITCYQQKLMQQGDTRLRIEVGMEGRALALRNTVKIIIPRLNIDGEFQIRSIRKSLTRYELDLISYNSTIYDYTIGTLPPDATPDNTPDYSNTAPAAPTSFTIDAQGIDQGTDGTTTTYYELSATAPAANFSHMIFGYKKAGSSAYKYLEGELGSGEIWKIRIEGLTPGISYNLAAVSVNAFNLKSSLATLLSQLAPGDTTGPGTVSGLTGSGKYKTWHWKWNARTEDDLRDYDVQIGTTPGGNNVFDGYVAGTSIDFTDNSQGYGTLYCRVKARDLTGNLSSSWTSNVAATTSQTQAGDIGGNQVTYPKRQLVEEQSASFNLAPGVGQNNIFVHNFSRKPIITATIGIPIELLEIQIASYTADSFNASTKNNNTQTLIGTILVTYW